MSRCSAPPPGPVPAMHRSSGCLWSDRDHNRRVALIPFAVARQVVVITLETGILDRPARRETAVWVRHVRQPCQEFGLDGRKCGRIRHMACNLGFRSEADIGDLADGNRTGRVECARLDHQGLKPQLLVERLFLLFGGWTSGLVVVDRIASAMALI